MSKKACHSELVSGTQNMETPHELPQGWKWCRQNEVCRLTDGEKKTDVSYPYLEVKYLRGNKEKDFVTSGKFIKAGTKVILVDGENSGEVFTVPEDGFMGSTFKALSIQNVDKTYLQFFIQTKKDLYRNNKKGSAIPHLNKELFFNMPFPLPPTLVEQQRIVNRIETMFAKLDQAQEKAQAVLDSFETRKAAILHKAFTGQLTANWRKENSINLCEIDDILNKLFAVRDTLIANKTIQKAKISTEFDERFVSYLCPDWKVVKLGSIAFVTKLAGFEYTKYIKLEETGEIPAIRAQNVRKGYLDETNLLYISKEVSEFLQRSSLTKKSVLVTFIGAGIGDVCVFDKPTRYHLAPNVAKIEPFNSENEDFINVKYIMYYLISNFGQHEIFIYKNATAQPSLSMETIRDIEIPITSLPEQKEIVRILDTVLEKESRAKEAAQTVLDQIALLKKSILARAFRGEL